MSNFYSQHGEDVLLNEMFKQQAMGFFVEVGCIDGRRFSNTLTFEERGWKGLCVEAHSNYIELLKKNRPNSIVCHCAAAESDEEEAVFYANSRGSLSTLDKTKELEFREQYKEYFNGFEEQIVKKRRLDSLLREYNINDIDILSLDIEGCEVEAIRGIDFQNYKPAVLLIESDSKEHEHALDRILFPAGYKKSVRLANNIYYVIDRKLHENIVRKTYRAELIHTRHPLDKLRDETVLVEFSV